MTLTRDNVTVEGLNDIRSFRTQANVIATSATPITLTAVSEHLLILTGTYGGQIVNLPSALTLSIGHRFSIHNNSTGSADIVDGGGTVLLTIRPKERQMAVLQAAGSAAGTWSIEFLSVSDSNTVYGVSTAVIEDFAYDEQGLDIGHTPGGFIRGDNGGTGTAEDILTSGALMDTNSYGVVRLSTGTTATGRAWINSQASWIQLGVGTNGVVEFRAKIPVLSTALQRFAYYLGWMDGNSSGQPTNGIYFLYSDNVLDGDWALRTVAGGVASTVDTNIPVAANTWYRVRFEWTAASSVAIYINDVLIARTTLTIPTSQIHPVIKVESSVGTNNKIVYLDWMFWRIDRTTAT